MSVRATGVGLLTSSQALLFVQMKCIGFKIHIINYLVPLGLRCPDGSIMAHKVLLQLSCQNIAEMLLQRMACPCNEDLVTLVIPGT